MKPVPVPEQEIGVVLEESVKQRTAKESLQEEAKRLLAPFGFPASVKRELWEAFKANPDGMERCALEAKAYAQREGRNGGGLLLTMIRRGDHLLEPDLTVERPTGWRWVRGLDGQAGTYVEDPEGIDRLPKDYDFTPSSIRERAPELSDAEPLTDEVYEQLKRLRGDRPDEVEGAPA